MPAPPCYFAWGCFQYFGGSEPVQGGFTLTRHLARARHDPGFSYLWLRTAVDGGDRNASNRSLTMA